MWGVSARLKPPRRKLTPGKGWQHMWLESARISFTATVDEQLRINTYLESLQYERGNHDSQQGDCGKTKKFKGMMI